MFIRRTGAKAEAPIIWPPISKSLACCIPGGGKALDTTEQLRSNTICVHTANVQCSIGETLKFVSSISAFVYTLETRFWLVTF